METYKTGTLSQAYFAKLKVKNNQLVSYFAVGGWELTTKHLKTLPLSESMFWI